MDHLGVGREIAQPSGDPVVEAHTQADEQVGLVNGQVVVGHAVHPRHPHVQYVVGGDGADAQQCGDDRDLRLFGQLDQFVVSLGYEYSVSGHYYRPLGLVDELGGTGNLIRGGVSGRMITGEIGLFGPDELRPQVLEHVFGNVHQHRAGPPGSGDVEGFLDSRCNVLDFHHQEVVLGDGQRDASHIGFLEGVPPNCGARHLSGDGHHRHRVHLGGGDAGNQVGGAWAAGCGADANPSGGAGVSVRGHGCRLLMAHQHVPQIRVFGHRSI